jgi:hypothetical protein
MKSIGAPRWPSSLTTLLSCGLVTVLATSAWAQVAPPSTPGSGVAAPATAVPPGPYPTQAYPPPPGIGRYIPPGYYLPPIAPDPPASATHVGVGYKIGNGLGFEGADLIVSPVPHVVLDLQANRFSFSGGIGRDATGYGLAPGVQLYLNAPGRSTPYLAAGWLQAKVKLDGASGSGNGFFVNAGYEWKWTNGLGILLGGGLGYLTEIDVSGSTSAIHNDGGLHPNLEAGLRYMVL